jgi:hypothetical protein
MGQILTGTEVATEKLIRNPNNQNFVWISLKRQQSTGVVDNFNKVVSHEITARRL